MREEYRIEGLPEPLSHYTDAVRAGDLLFVSGIVPVDGEGRLVGGGDVVAQATQVFESLRLVLAAAGATPAGRREGDRLPHGRRRPTADQPGTAGVLRRCPAGIDARRDQPSGGSRRENRGGGGRGAARMSDDWNAFITRVEPGRAPAGTAFGPHARRQGSLRHGGRANDLWLEGLRGPCSRSEPLPPCSGSSTPAP